MIFISFLGVQEAIMNTSFLLGFWALFISACVAEGELKIRTSSAAVAGFSNASINDIEDRTTGDIVENAVVGLEIIEKFGEGLVSVFENDKDNFKRLLGVLKFVPYLGVVSGILGVFLPTQTQLSQQLEDIQKKLVAIDGRLTSISTQISGLSDKVALEHSRTRLSIHIDRLEVAEHRYQSYLKNDQKKDDQYKKRVIEEYTGPSLSASIISVYNQIINGPSLADNLYSATDGDYRSIERQFLSLQGLIIKGVQVFTLGCRLKEKDGPCQRRGRDLMTPYQDRFAKKFTDALYKCRVNDIPNMKKDVLKLLEENPTSGVDNTKMANIITDHLKKKYFWKDYTVVVYNPITGDHVHQVRGWYFFRTHGRNTVILAGNQVPSPFSSARAPAKVSKWTLISKLKLSSLFYTTKRSCFRRRCTTNKTYHRREAKWLFQQVESRLKANGYNHAGLVVLKHGSGVKANLGHNGLTRSGGYSQRGVRGRTFRYYFDFIIELNDRQFN